MEWQNTFEKKKIVHKGVKVPLSRQGSKRISRNQPIKRKEQQQIITKKQKFGFV